MGDSKSLIHELLQGLELTRQLQLYLNVPSSSSNETRELLIQQIITTFEKALQMVNRKGHVAESSQQQQPARTVGIRMLDSPPLSCSPKSEDSDRDFQDHHRNAFKKRNTMPIRWTKKIRVTPGVRVEGPLDDGYSWRKYGQKEILGALHPRGYYRCSHRNVEGCLATKQVQRSDEDSTVFEITYRGNHTCTMESNVVALPTLNPNENQETNVNTNLQSMRTGLRVQTENLDFLDQPFGSIFSSPAVLESSFVENFNSPSANSGISQFSMSPNSSVFPNITTSVANTPTTSLEFPIDQFEFDRHNFTFDNSPFF
ncbi:probable WRKY transcription factor 53 [Cicer arietinum]|uniref:Probable WRKY transcription factor 53 n=1 Tax=Cicer arietinum TaxID=3827 RepID=A0A1S2YC26_CICAR|nr:probable WRKY transcription factor 53 [Cicer arietinum]